MSRLSPVEALRIDPPADEPVGSRSSRLGAELTFALKAARPGFWTTSLWFYLLPLGQRPVFGSIPFWLGALYMTFPLGLLLYGANDLVDVETDRHNPRKGTFLFGARGGPEQLARLPGWIALVQLPFVVGFTVLAGPKMLLWFAALLAATIIYNWPPPGLKGRPGWDLINQVGYLLVFLGSSWINHAPPLPWPALVFGALFAMHSHLFGQVMDVEPDRLAGRRTTAAVLGVIPAKLLLAGFLAAEAGLVWIAFRDGWMALGLGLGGGWFVLDATLLWRDRLYRPAEMKVFLMGWNVVAVATMPWVWATATLTHTAAG